MNAVFGLLIYFVVPPLVIILLIRYFRNRHKPEAQIAMGLVVSVLGFIVGFVKTITSLFEFQWSFVIIGLGFTLSMVAYFLALLSKNLKITRIIFRFLFVIFLISLVILFIVILLMALEDKKNLGGGFVFWLLTAALPVLIIMWPLREGLKGLEKMEM